MTLLVAIACYYLGIDALFYWLNRKAKRILTFHNVLRDDLFKIGVANGVSTSLSNFIKVIDECSRRFGFSLDLADPKTLTITFDDGYANQYTTAFSALKKRHIPAYLFCCGNCLKGKTLTVDKLMHWLDGVPVGEYDLGEYGHIFVTPENRAQLWQSILWPAFMRDSARFGEGVLNACDAAFSITKVFDRLSLEYKEERLMGISARQCTELRQYGWQVGWHTQHHFPLSQLAHEIAKEEMTPPQEMADVIFSYPYGEEKSVSKREIGLAKELCYPSAVSNIYGSVNNTSRYFLPRMALSSNKYLLHFMLSGCKFALQRRRLLPSVQKDV